MTYLKVIALGSMAGVEDWSCGISFRYFQLSFVDLNQAQLESIVQRLITNVTATGLGASLRSALSTSASLTGWRVESHGEDERILAVAQNNYTVAIAGTGTATKTPQDAMVFSLRTETPGARGRGRIYWPALGVTLQSGFKMAPTNVTEYLNGAKALFKLIGDQVNAELAANSLAATVELSVRSITDHASRYVNRVQLGDVLDTQRRRRDNLVEAYTTTSYP